MLIPFIHSFSFILNALVNLLRRAGPGAGEKQLKNVDIPVPVYALSGDGIAETIINALTGIEGLRVIARTAAVFRCLRCGAVLYICWHGPAVPRTLPSHPGGR